MRQGRKFQILGKYRGLDTMQVAEGIVQFREKHSPDAIVLDGAGKDVFCKGARESTEPSPDAQRRVLANPGAKLWGEDLCASVGACLFPGAA